MARRTTSTTAFARLIAAFWMVLAQPLMASEVYTSTLLRVTGPGFSIDLNRAALDQLPQKRLVTETIWTNGEIQFSGPTLASVLELGNISAQPVTAIAANNYAVTILPEYIDQDYPIIATNINGKPFSVREKGPLWIIFPFNQRRFQNEVIYSLSVWQLVEIQLDQ